MFLGRVKWEGLDRGVQCPHTLSMLYNGLAGLFPVPEVGEEGSVVGIQFILCAVILPGVQVDQSHCFF